MLIKCSSPIQNILITTVYNFLARERKDSKEMKGKTRHNSIPEPTGDEPTLRLCRLPFLSRVGDFWRLELVTLPAADATDDVGEAEETERWETFSWFLFPLGRPGPCLLCLFPFRFFSFTASSSITEVWARLYPAVGRLELPKSPGEFSKLLGCEITVEVPGWPTKELKLFTPPSWLPDSPLCTSLVDDDCWEWG